MSVQNVEQAVRQVSLIVQDWHDGKTPDFIEKPTRTKIIDPVLIALGWRVRYGKPHNRKPCITEYYPYEDSGDQADYAMFDDKGKVRVIGEAKRIKEHTQGHYAQLDRYLEDATNMVGFLTNGEWWNIVELDSTGNDKEHNPINIANPNAARQLYRLLSRDEINSKFLNSRYR